MTDEQEKMAITKYDLFYESRITKVETAIDYFKESLKELKTDFRWIIGISITMWVTIIGIMAKGFGWI